MNGLLNSLINNAAKLSHTALEKPDKVIGNDTTTCIQSGIVYGTVCMIEGMLNKIKSQIGNCKVLLTGGNASYIKDVLECDVEYCSNLLIEGLMELYARNK